jgi:predicted nucleic-acid-binding protein
MLQADVFVVENEQQVFSAMIAVRDGIATFADALIVALAARAGCSTTLTFDQRALRLAGFSAP